MNLMFANECQNVINTIVNRIQEYVTYKIMYVIETFNFPLEQ